jgi:uncharacterized integral membrane protein
VARDDGRKVEQRSIPWRLIGAVVAVLVIIDFMVQNNDTVTVHFLFFSRESHVWVVLLITGVLAIIAAELGSSYIRRRRENKD